MCVGGGGEGMCMHVCMYGGLLLTRTMNVVIHSHMFVM